MPFWEPGDDLRPTIASVSSPDDLAPRPSRLSSISLSWLSMLSMSISPSISTTVTSLPNQSSSYIFSTAPGSLPSRVRSFFRVTIGNLPPFFWISLTFRKGRPLSEGS